MFYISRENFQNYVSEYYKKNKTKLDFITAFNNLKKENKLKNQPFKIPNFIDFDNTSDEDFLFYINKFNLSFQDTFGQDATSLIEEEDIIPEGKDVFVIQHLQDLKDLNHSHNYFEIDYVFRGNCVIEFEGEKVLLKEGSFFILSPFSKHNIYLEKNTAVITLCIRKSTFYTTFFSLLSQNDMLSVFFRTIFLDETKNNYLFFETNNEIAIKKIIKNLSLENNKYDSYSNNSCVCWINLLFTIILRNHKSSVQYRNYENYTDFSTILKYIKHNHLTVTLNDLAELFHYTPPYLSKLIKINTGKTFSSLIKELKMSNAINYLNNSNLKISEISEICGYNSMDHFSRTFRSIYNVSPQQYRKDNRN